MTLDEAIKELREASDSEVRYGDKEHHYNEVMRRVEAFDMAIEALEQQPCEDCISRTELLSKIDAERKYLLNLKMDGAEHIIVHHARRIIEDMPPVTPQRDNSVLERVGDCISRKAAIEHREILKDKQGTGYQAVKTKYIRELPPVTPQPKMGRWMHPYKSDIACECSECHIQMPITNYFKYCPNCGARMEVGE